jgi:hypothetical protein
MAKHRLQSVGTTALGLSLATFTLFFLSVLVGGPLHMKPLLSDVGEMLTLFVAVTFFVAGTLAREAQAHTERGPPTGDDTSGPGDG